MENLRYVHPLGADNGLAGVTLAKAKNLNLVLCDVMRPKLDGNGVLHALREFQDTAAIPFIFLTPKGEKVDRRNGMNLGADNDLTKPVGKDDLLQAIHARLRSDAQQAQAEFKPDFNSPALLYRLGLAPSGWLKSCSGLRKAKPMAKSALFWALVNPL